MKKLRCCLFIMTWALSASVWAAGAVLLDGTQLREVLKKGQPCCVIDARSEGRRKQHPIPFAVTYQEGIKPQPGGFAVVVGDNDLQALAVARSVAGKNKHDVYAVKGGYAAWRQVSVGGNKSSAEAEIVAPQRFTIPSNTCEQGKSLQEYK